MAARRGGLRLLARRFVLAASVGLAHRAAAQLPAKVSQAAAKYQASPRGGMSCEACSFFRRPHACQVVEGEVSANGWCQLFDMPD